MQLPHILAPRDLKTEGTWFGVNRHLLTVAILNRRSKMRGSRSRGRLVVDLLEKCASVEDAMKHLRSASLNGYAPSTMFIADPVQGLTLYLPDAANVCQIDKFPLVITERGVDGKSARAKFIHKNFALVMNDTNEIGCLKTFLTEHKSTINPWYSTCCHGNLFSTLSSQILFTDPSKGTARFLHAEGQPCKSPYFEYQFPGT